MIEEIHDLLRFSPAPHLNEIASWIALTYGQPGSISTVQRSLKTLGYSVKKLRKAVAQRDELTREQSGRLTSCHASPLTGWFSRTSQARSTEHPSGGMGEQ